MQIFEATLSLWGKSTALRIPSALVKSAHLTVGQTVRFKQTADGDITLHLVMERPKLETLLALVTPDNLPNEADTAWGKPVGSEAW